MAGIKAANPDDILQAIEDQLVAASVIGSADAVYWVIDGDDSDIKPTGIHRIFLYWTDEVSRQAWQVGGGRYTTLMDFECEVRLDTFQAQDRPGSRKDWLKDHFAQRASLIDSILGLFPVDSGNNALTIYGLRIVRNVPPTAMSLKRFGKGVCTMYGSFLPKVTYTDRSKP